MELKKILSNDKLRRRVRIIYFSFLAALFIMMVFTNVSVRYEKDYEDYKHIALYVIKFHNYPSNYISKYNSGNADGNELYLYETYRNDDNLLPNGVTYTSIYVNATKDYVGLERIVFSDKQVFYTDDHYRSFDEITKSDILKIHYTFILLFWLLSLSGAGLLIYLVKKEYISLKVIKNDINKDYQLLILNSKNFCKKFMLKVNRGINNDE